MMGVTLADGGAVGDIDATRPHAADMTAIRTTAVRFDMRHLYH